MNRHYFAHSVTSENNPQWLTEVICCDPFFSRLLCPLVLYPRTHNLMAPFFPKVFIPWPLTCLSLHLIIHSCAPTLCSPPLPTQTPEPCWASGCQKHEVLWQRPPAGMLSQGCYWRCWFRHRWAASRTASFDDCGSASFASWHMLNISMNVGNHEKLNILDGFDQWA